MPESTLALSYTDFMNHLARVLAMGDDYTALAQGDQDVLDGYVQSGYRQFLKAYDWHFLEPVRTITAWVTHGTGSGTTVTGGTYQGNTTVMTASAAAFFPSMVGKDMVITSVGTFAIESYTSSTVVTVTGNASAASASTMRIAADGFYRLPDDYGGIIGDLVFEANSGRYQTLGVDSWFKIQSLLQRDTSTGRPRIAGFKPLETFSLTVGQRWDLGVYPIPDADYPLFYKMRVAPNKLSINNPYPYGGMDHSETILHAILASAKLLEDDEIAEHQSKFDRLLIESKRRDDEFGAPEELGMNIDRSDEAFRYLLDHRLTNYNVTYNGVLYS